MNHFLIISILTIFIFSCTPDNKAATQQSSRNDTQPAGKNDAPAGKSGEAAEITFTYTRQSGSASNQYAVWIEDVNGKHVKTLYATRWTANGGFSRRPASIPLWVQKSGLAGMSGAQVDAVSGATPSTGAVTLVWDGTDSKGAAVSNGNYMLILEATLRWENQAYYRAPIALGQGAVAAKVNVEYTEGERDAAAERLMIRDVGVKVLR